MLALNSSNLVLAPKTGGPLGLPATAAVRCGGKHLYLQQDEHLFKPAADCFNASEQKKKSSVGYIQKQTKPLATDNLINGLKIKSLATTFS